MWSEQKEHAEPAEFSFIPHSEFRTPHFPRVLNFSIHPHCCVDSGRAGSPYYGDLRTSGRMAIPSELAFDDFNSNTA